MFVLESDFDFQIRSQVLSLVKNTDKGLQDVLKAAQSEMESLLRGRYDVAKIFAPLMPWQHTVVYRQEARILLNAPAWVADGDKPKDTIVLKDGKIYRAKTDVNSDTWESELPSWEEIGKPNDLWYVTADQTTAGLFSDDEYAPGDTRYPVILMYLKDMALYHIHSNISPQNIPKLREDRYNKAMEWLKMVIKDQANPDLPVLPGRESGIFKIGSRPKVSQGW